MVQGHASKGKINFPSLQEERIFIEKWQLEKDQNALLNLILAYRPLITNLAREHSRNPDRRAELFNTGVLTFIEVLEKFTPKEKTRLGSYARSFIRASMVELNHTMNSPIEVPRHSLRNAKRKDPVSSEASMLRAMTTKISLGDMQEEVAAPEEICALEIISQKQTISSWKASLQRAFDELPKDEKEVMTLRLKDEDDKTKDIAQKLGISASRVRALEARAMTRLKSLLLTRGFDISQLAA